MSVRARREILWDVRNDEHRLLERFAARRSPDDLEALVMRYRPLARSFARRYAKGALALEDLEQVACVGLVKALQRFDPERGTAFATFAVPTILGELRRHCREALWPVYVPRAVQERAGAVRRAADGFAASKGRPPTAAELASALGWCEEDVLDAVRAATTRVTTPLDATSHAHGEDAIGPADRIGVEEPGYRFVEEAECVASAVAALSDREREALRLRFDEDLAQHEIARRMQLPQSRIGNLLATALERVRAGAASGPVHRDEHRRLGCAAARSVAAGPVQRDAHRRPGRAGGTPRLAA